MGTGFKGTFVVSWSQTEIDGFCAAPLDTLNIGASWGWQGEAIRVDGPSTMLQLDAAEGAQALRKRAARMVKRLVGAALDGKPQAPIDVDALDDMLLMDNSFVVTDGAKTYCVTLIETGPHSRPLLMFCDDMPPQDREMWVVHHTMGIRPHDSLNATQGGVICFTPGTRILTPTGPVQVEDLREGDTVQTKDNGAQQINWIGSREMTGARLFTMPKLRPIRISRNVLGQDIPDGDLRVSPQHRLLVKGAAARDLFNTDEVLVAAEDLVNGTTVTVDTYCRDVQYIHLLLDQHQVVWANGVETESFHPAAASLASLGEPDRARLLSAQPDLIYDPHSYGAFARRVLTNSEAAILQHAA